MNNNKTYNFTSAIYTIMGIIMVTIFALCFPFQVILAENSTPSATPIPTQATASAQIEDLKARLATKVAQLRSVVKRAMYGTVKSVSLTSATVETKTQNIKIELTDDVSVTQIVGGKRTSLPIEKLEVKDTITVFGEYDETLELLKARFIFIENTQDFVRVAGTIADIDKEDFVLTVNTVGGRSITIDFEKTTKTTMWTKDAGLAKGGFSKIAVGDTIHILGTPIAKTENKISATRILDLGNINGHAVTPSVTENPTATSTATPKVTPKITSTP